MTDTYCLKAEKRCQSPFCRRGEQFYIGLAVYWYEVYKAGNVSVNVISAGRFIIRGVLGKSGFYWILVDVVPDKKIVAKVSCRTGIKARAPQVIYGAVHVVPAFSRYGFYPLHYPGQVCAVYGGYKQMNVGRHDTKIMQAEAVFFLCIL